MDSISKRIEMFSPGEVWICLLIVHRLNSVVMREKADKRQIGVSKHGAVHYTKARPYYSRRIIVFDVLIFYRLNSGKMVWGDKE